MNKSKEVWNNQDIRDILSIKNLSWVGVRRKEQKAPEVNRSQITDGLTHEFGF